MTFPFPFGSPCALFKESIWLDSLTTFLKNDNIKAIVWYPIRAILGNACWTNFSFGRLNSRNNTAIFNFRIFIKIFLVLLRFSYLSTHSLYFYYYYFYYFFFQVDVMSKLWFQVQRLYCEWTTVDGVSILDVSSMQAQSTRRWDKQLQCMSPVSHSIVVVGAVVVGVVVVGVAGFVVCVFFYYCCCIWCI